MFQSSVLDFMRTYHLQAQVEGARTAELNLKEENVSLLNENALLKDQITSVCAIYRFESLFSSK